MEYSSLQRVHCIQDYIIIEITGRWARRILSFGKFINKSPPPILALSSNFYPNTHLGVFIKINFICTHMFYVGRDEKHVGYSGERISSLRFFFPGQRDLCAGLTSFWRASFIQDTIERQYARSTRVVCLLRCVVNSSPLFPPSRARSTEKNEPVPNERPRPPIRDRCERSMWCDEQENRGCAERKKKSQAKLHRKAAILFLAKKRSFLARHFARSR